MAMFQKIILFLPVGKWCNQERQTAKCKYLWVWFWFLFFCEHCQEALKFFINELLTEENVFCIDQESHPKTAVYQMLHHHWILEDPYQVSLGGRPTVAKLGCALGWSTVGSVSCSPAQYIFGLSRSHEVLQCKRSKEATLQVAFFPPLPSHSLPSPSLPFFHFQRLLFICMEPICTSPLCFFTLLVSLLYLFTWRSFWFWVISTKQSR